ncbi:MAG: GWxTD domain-containing protein [Syntrophomonadaceae bacterium]
MKTALVFISLFLPGLALLAQTADIPAASRGSLQFYVDHAGFQGKEGKTYEEFYLMVQADQLTYKKETGRQLGTFKTTFKLTDKSNVTVSERQWVTDVAQKKDSAYLKTMAAYDQWQVPQLQPGEYNAEITVADMNGPNSARASFPFNVPSIPVNKFTSSEIEFVSGIEEKPLNTTFLKANRSIIPNPSRRYGILSPILYTFYELYNIPPEAGRNLWVTYSIKSNDRTVKTFPVMGIKRSGNSAVITHGMSVSGIPSGVYDLNVQVKDSLAGKEIVFSRKFEVIQADYARQQRPALTEDEAATFGRIIQYIAAPSQYKIYEGLDLKGKAQFLIQYWRQNDPTPETQGNEILTSIQQRYNYANNNFTWGKQEGWKTDRGRVLIKYGSPDEIEHHNFETNTLPYEIWIYNQKKSYIFVFADLRSNGSYTLLHSNKEEEVHNELWMEQIRKL